MDCRLQAITWTLALAGAVGAQQDPPAPPPPALAKARARATVHNKRVLVALPAPGQDLAAMIRRERKLSRTVRYEFEVVQGTADMFWPLQRPALLVQDASGRILSHLQAADFLAEGELLGSQLLQRLEPHFCPPADAEEKLAAAMAVAKKTGRNILIRFDAPW